MEIRPASKQPRALTRTEVLVVVVVLFAGVVMVLLPAFSRARAMARMATCQSHLKQIGIATRAWENDNGPLEWGAGDNIFKAFQGMSNQSKDPQIFICPADNRKPAKDFATLNHSNLSYFIGPDADETRPTMLLAGDRNLMTNGVAVVPGLVVIGTNAAVGWTAKVHNRVGNLVLEDGSVDAYARTLPAHVVPTGTNAIRLAVP